MSYLNLHIIDFFLLFNSVCVCGKKCAFHSSHVGYSNRCLYHGSYDVLDASSFSSRLPHCRIRVPSPAPRPWHSFNQSSM